MVQCLDYHRPTPTMASIQENYADVKVGNGLETTHNQKAFYSADVLRPLIPVEVLPVIAGVALSFAFLLAFFFTTWVLSKRLLTNSRLPRSGLTVKEPIIALMGSLFAGVGVVALFNAIGVYVQRVSMQINNICSAELS